MDTLLQTPSKSTGLRRALMNSAIYHSLRIPPGTMFLSGPTRILVDRGRQAISRPTQSEHSNDTDNDREAK